MECNDYKLNIWKTGEEISGIKNGRNKTKKIQTNSTMEDIEERDKSKEDLLPQNPKNGENQGADFELENIEFEEDSDKKKLEFKYQEKNLKDGTVTSKAILETSNNEILIVDEDKGVEHKIEMKKDEKDDSWFVKIQKKIVGTVFKEETIEALQELFSNYRTISKDLRDYSWMSILMACKLIALHDETNKINTTGSTFDNLEEMREINLWWQYSRASFGWQYNLALKFQRNISGLIDGFLKDTDSINKSIIAENCGIAVEDILITNWTSDLFMPGYYMALDHKQESIVIAIRGSFELKDSLIDLKGHKVSFMGGAVHDGMLVATLKVKQQLDQKFKEYKEKYPGYKIICTGYSLGASCAALYTILILEEYKEIDIHAYCFACPAVLTLDLATKYKRYVTSVLHNKDMVPRVSFGSLEDLKSKIINILKQRAGFVGRSFQIMSGLNFFKSNSKTKLEKILKTPSQPNCFVDYKPRHSLRLWPPGKVLYMYFTNENGQKKLHVENSHPSLFSNLVISNTMFTDHLPNIYEESLAGCESAILREIEEKKSKEVDSSTQPTSDEKL